MWICQRCETMNENQELSCYVCSLEAVVSNNMLKEKNEQRKRTEKVNIIKENTERLQFRERNTYPKIPTPTPTPTPEIPFSEVKHDDNIREIKEIERDISDHKKSKNKINIGKIICTIILVFSIIMCLLTLLLLLLNPDNSENYNPFPSIAFYAVLISIMIKKINNK